MESVMSESTRVPPGQPGARGVRQRDVAASRRAILDAAESLFAEQGYHATSLQEVCDRAGVSRGMPGYLFGSKEGLYRAVLDRFADVPLGVVRDMGAGAAGTAADGRAALEAAIGAFLDFLLANPNFVRLMEWDALYGGQRAREQEAVRVSLRQARAVVAEGFGFGPLDEGEAAQFLTSVVALLWFPLVHSPTFLEPLGLDAKDAGFIADRRRHVTRLILDGLAGRAEKADREGGRA
jgi:TetR/AcrR family transcriptional regulator